MRKIQFTINGKTHRGYGQKIKNQLWLHFNGKTLIYHPQAPDPSESEEKIQGESIIKAPMPGQIIKVLKNVGDSVQVGENLIVIEAMKMEYSLPASIEGSVERICCAIKDQVEVGQTLMELGAVLEEDNHG